MDKYLEEIMAKESQLANFTTIIDNNQNKLISLKLEKKSKEAELNNLNAEYLRNEELKKRIINFPKLKKHLKLMAVISGLVMIIPFSSLLFIISITLNTLLLNIINLVYIGVILFKTIKTYQHNISDELSVISGTTQQKIDMDNTIIDQKRQKVSSELSTLNNLISDVAKFICEYSDKKSQLQIDIDNMKVRREQVISNILSEMLNKQYELEINSSVELSLQKKFMTTKGNSSIQ